MEDSKQIKVANRTNNTVGYTIPDMQNLHRSFSAREEKIITFEELRKLSYVPGGETMIKDYLIIKDNQAIEALNLNIQPEYFYTEKEIINLMQNGTMDEFLDCLDFAPDGVLDMIKDLAVSLPLNDVAKRDAINQKLDFNVGKAIEMIDITEEPGVNKNSSGRRAAVPSKDTQNETTQQQLSSRRVVKKVN